MNPKQFIFLYPIPPIIDYEIQNHGWHEDGGIEAYRQKYKSVLNKCIDVRYRQKDFDINYAIFDDTIVSEVIELQKSDRIIKVGLDYKKHTTKQPNGRYPYPNQNYILNQLGDVRILRIAGFHMWDCVERLAKRAYKRKLDVLVDEDLTEFFTGRLNDPNFKVDKYPTYNPRDGDKEDIGFKFFMKARMERPWLWQEY
jgi:hypothetical protein